MLAGEYEHACEHLTSIMVSMSVLAGEYEHACEHLTSIMVCMCMLGST